MSAMQFAWTILKNDPLEPHERRDWDNHYSQMSMADVKQLDPEEQAMVFDMLQRVMAGQGTGTALEGAAMTQGAAPPSEEIRQSMEFFRKYDPSTYNEPGQPLPMGAAPPKDPEMARRTQQQAGAERQAETARIQSHRDNVLAEMEEVGLTEESMGALPFHDLMRASKTPEGMARLQQMIAQAREGGAGAPSPPRAQIGKGSMSAIDAAWAVLKSM